MKIINWLNPTSLNIQGTKDIYTTSAKGSCSCPDHLHRKRECKHITYIRNVIECSQIKNKLHAYLVYAGIKIGSVIGYTLTKKGMYAVTYWINGGKGCSFINPNKLPDKGNFRVSDKDVNKILLTCNQTGTQYVVAFTAQGYSLPLQSAVTKYYDDVYSAVISFPHYRSEYVLWKGKEINFQKFVADRSNPCNILKQRLNELSKARVSTSKIDTFLGYSAHLFIGKEFIGVIGYSETQKAYYWKQGIQFMPKYESLDELLDKYVLSRLAATIF
jgi:hypothetical protein